MSRFNIAVSDIKDPKMLMGYAIRGDVISVEDNLVNRIVLGMDTNFTWQTPELRYKNVLLPFQVPDVMRMVTQKFILNANPMGLGKTVETIIAMRELGLSNGIIVVPKILKTQWQTQLAKWWPNSPKAVIVEGPKTADFSDSHCIYILNYEQVTNNVILTGLRKRRWDVCILDEAHRIKNRKSQRSIATKSIPAARRWALTGTPILRYVDDLWSILNYLGPYYSGISYWNFVNYFCKIEETFWGKKIAGMTSDVERIKILNTLLSIVFIRNDAVNVAQGKTISTITLSLPAKVRKLYSEAKALVLDELPESMTIPNGAVLTMRLRQVTSWPGLYVPGIAGPKFEYILEKAQLYPEYKFVVFTAFAKTAEALIKYLNTSGVKAVGIIGTQDAHENVCSKLSFVEGDAQVLVGTIAAMGQGYDGLQDVSRCVIMMERDWSPEINHQCEDRLHRMGQKLPVNVEYLECDKTFDQKVTRINITKSDDIRAALRGE